MPDPDLSEFIALSKPPRPPCVVCVARELLSKQDRANLDAALAMSEQQITNKGIARWFAQPERNLRDPCVTWQRVIPHRKGVCSGLPRP